MTKKILTTCLNKDGTRGTVGMIVPDSILPSDKEERFDLFKLKMKRRLYWLRFKVELFFQAKLSLKNRHAEKTINEFTKACNEVADDLLLSPIKDMKAEMAKIDIDPRWSEYRRFKQAIDAGKPVMYVDLDEEK